MKPIITFVYPIIRLDFINKSLETLLKYTDKEKYRVIIVDQSIEGYEKEFPNSFQVLMKNNGLLIRQKNAGFSNAANKGIIQALRWNTPYIAVVNDDTEFMYSGWLEDLLEEFKTDPRIVAVCPESPRVPLWGYGRPHDENLDIVPYKEEYTPEDIAMLKSGIYDFILDRYPLEPLNLPINSVENKPDWNGKIYVPVEKRPEVPERYGKSIFPGVGFPKAGVIDGIAMWLPVFKREGLIELGLFDEKFVWGGGEDYDMNTRAYSCAWPIPRDVCDEKFHKRMVSTMKSWVWHHWGQSKDVKAELDPKLFEGKEAWNNTDELWPPEINQGFHMDVWGHFTKDGIRQPLKRIPEVSVDSA